MWKSLYKTAKDYKITGVDGLRNFNMKRSYFISFVEVKIRKNLRFLFILNIHISDTSGKKNIQPNRHALQSVVSIPDWVK